ncbi:MAG: hypothetical protein ACOVT5_05945, partial [Armatimonadaceae bacterium]
MAEDLDLVPSVDGPGEGPVGAGRDDREADGDPGRGRPQPVEGGRGRDRVVVAPPEGGDATGRRPAVEFGQERGEG